MAELSWAGLLGWPGLTWAALLPPCSQEPVPSVQGGSSSLEYSCALFPCTGC